VRHEDLLHAGVEVAEIGRLASCSSQEPPMTRPPTKTYGSTPEPRRSAPSSTALPS
jgi:hypothetical protein